MAAVLTVLLAGPCVTAFALDPTVEELRAELRRLFPAPALLRSASDPVAPVNPYAIVRRDYLYTRPLDLMAPSGRVSFSRLREYPHALLEAHATCVKILTPYWHGAGVIVSATGDILTSYHLVAGVTTASVQTIEGRIRPIGSVLAYSAADDLALLHIEGGPFPALTVRDGAPPAPNAPLSIVGHPTEQSWRLTQGRVIRQCADAGTRVLHFESDIGHGNSGGPVVDAEGRLCALTACAAELADGSHVKIGTAAEAIRDFLAKRPGGSLSLPDLAATERNRQAAEFLELIYGFTEELMTDWQTTLAQTDVEAMPDFAVETDARPASVRKGTPAAVSFARIRHGSDAAAQLVLVQTILRRCIASPGLNPELVRSMTHCMAVLDGLLETAALLSYRTNTPAEARQKIRLAAERQALAGQQFVEALTILEEAGKGLALRTATSGRHADLEQIRIKYATTGCRVRATPGG